MKNRVLRNTNFNSFSPIQNSNSFQERWKRNMVKNTSDPPIMDLNIYGIWACDAVTALAIAAEETLLLTSTAQNGANTRDLRISSSGPILLSKLSNVKFRGLAGDFQLDEGKLKPSPCEIFNVVGSGERRVGFWTPERGIMKELRTFDCTDCEKELRKIVWPGDSMVPPMGWKIPANGILRVGVPWKPGYKEFVDLKFDPVTNRTTVTGFAIDIFLTALKRLPFPVQYEFHYYNDSGSINWSYDSMLRSIPKEYDMVVADTTIWAPRAAYVDFSMPYSESGVALVVKNKKPVDMWIFIRPLRWDLWLAIIISSIVIGLVMLILERRRTNNVEKSSTNNVELTGCWSPIAILAFPERNMVLNKWSVFTLFCWMAMSFILMQSFTASFSAILTVDQLNFSLSKSGYVGYHEGSFLKNFLIDRLRINESRLRPYASVQEFHDAMSRGSKNGGVDAIFDEIPYMKLFINKYGTQYKMVVGQPYRTEGLGFAFPKGSPLVAYFSRAILNVTQGPDMNYLEIKNFGPGYSSQDPLSSVISQGTSTLTLRQFAGLFITVGCLTLLALFCSVTSIDQRIVNVVQRLSKRLSGCQ